MSNKYYGTHEEAIDELIEVNDGNIGLISKNENYRDLFKLSLIKVWFGGALCYFVMWGLSLYVSNDLDMFVLLSFVLAISTDFLLNPVLKYLYSKDNLYSKYIMVNIEYKKIRSLLINIFYSFLLIFCIYGIYVLLNSLIFKGALFVEPLLFGVIYMIVDNVFVFFKNLIIKKKEAV